MSYDDIIGANACVARQTGKVQKQTVSDENRHIEGIGSPVEHPAEQQRTKQGSVPSNIAAQRPAKLWNKSFVALIVVNLTMVLGQQILTAIVPLYAYNLGFSASLVGFIAGVFAISAIAARPFAGPAFDSFSKKKLFVIALAICGVTSAALAFLDTSGGIITVRLLQGVGIGCASPLGVALAAEVVPEKRVASGVSFYAVSQAVGQALGPALGLLIVRAGGYPITFWTVCILHVAAIIFLLLVVEPDHERPPYQLKLNRCFAIPALGNMFILGLLTMSFACTFSFMVIYGELRDVAQIGLYFTVYAGCLALTRPLFGKLAEKHGYTKILAPAMVCFALSFVIISAAADLPVFLAAALVAAFGFGVCSPLLQAEAISRVPDDMRGSASNTVWMGIDLGNLFGPLVAGAFIQALTTRGVVEIAAYSRMWLIMIVPISAALIALLLREVRRRSARRALTEPQRTRRQ